VIEIRSDGETLRADLYGSLPARRAAILVHGKAWDAAGWRPFAPRFAHAGLPALALNLRGYGGSTGVTNDYQPPAPWTPILDLRAAKAYLRERGVKEIALVGCSLGGHAVIGSTLERDVECVVSISAPVVAVPERISRGVWGRKLYLCASDDGATRHVLASFTALAEPKRLVLFGGTEHSIAMFHAAYGDDALRTVVDFVAKGL